MAQIPIEPFRHDQNITVGRGRILYGSACRPVLKVDDEGNVLRGVLKAGWVLPGGRRTQNGSEAVAAATWIDQNG